MNNTFYRYNFEPISNKLTNFEKDLSRLELIRYIENPDYFYKETAYIKKVDGKLSYYYLFSKIKSNDFNEGSGYLTHGFDFYRGSFHGQMVRGLINYCNLKEGSIVLDPFCGSGTTLVEANLLGFDSIGIDINPIACLNSKIKTELISYNLKDLTSDNEKYFKPSYFEGYVNRIQNFNRIFDQKIKNLFYFFLYTRALSTEFRFSINREISFKKNYFKLINVLRKFDNLKKEIDIKFGNSQILFNDNLIELKQIKTNYIDAIICSPPYMDLIDYIQEDIVPIKLIFRDDEIENLKLKSIGNKYKDCKYTEILYWKKINLFLKELFRILKPNKYFILIIGNYNDMKNNFEKLVLANNFVIERVLERKVVNIKRKQNIEYVFFLKT